MNSSMKKIVFTFVMALIAQQSHASLGTINSSTDPQLVKMSEINEQRHLIELPEMKFSSGTNMSRSWNVRVQREKIQTVWCEFHIDRKSAGLSDNEDVVLSKGFFGLQTIDFQSYKFDSRIEALVGSVKISGKNLPMAITCGYPVPPSPGALTPQTISTASLKGLQKVNVSYREFRSVLRANGGNVKIRTP